LLSKPRSRRDGAATSGFSVPEKEGTVALVEFPPGTSSMAHRHNAHVFVYVLEGSIVMQVKAAKRFTLKAGTRSMKIQTTSMSSRRT